MLIETIKLKNLVVEIHHDSDCEAPEDDLVSIAYSQRSRSILGNVRMDSDELQSIAERIDGGELIGLPVFAYVHGSVQIKASGHNPYHCQWDSGHSGFAYMRKEAAIKEWGANGMFTEHQEEHALKYIKAVVDEYSMWLNGETYGYVIRDLEGELLEDCWGFIGMDHVKDSALEEAQRWSDKLDHIERELAMQAEQEKQEQDYWNSRDVLTQP